MLSDRTPGGPAQTAAIAAAQVPGPVLFARYAYPPNSHGYCGPGDHRSFFEHGVARQDHPELRIMSQQFQGAWPYLELIAQATGLSDPLDRRAVEAYWVGSPRLDMINTRSIGNSMEERFRSMTGGQFSRLSESVLGGGVPHHSFAVFCIYPWTGLLSERKRAPHALTVLDRCRIRWGTVLNVTGDQVVVESAPLVWDGVRLSFGPRRAETVVRSRDGVGMLDDLAPGDNVSMHWEWICDRLTDLQVNRLRSYTLRHLKIVNAGNLHAGPARLLDA